MSRIRHLAAVILAGAVLLAPTSSRAAQSDSAVGSARAAIAFLRTGELYVTNADSSGQRKLSDSAMHTPPAWSHDGRAIAFVSKRDGNAEIYVVNTDGSGERRLTRNAVYDGDPAWSPDGRWIAFRDHGLVTRAGPGGIPYSVVYVVSADGTGQRSVSGDRDPVFGAGSDVRPVWSPDAQRIAFVRKISVARPKPRGAPGPPGPIIFHPAHLYVVNADGSGLERLTPEPVYGNLSRSASPTPVWSPDGRTIRFGRYVLNADGSGPRRVTRDFPLTGVWSPDGRKIAFQSTRDGNPEIYVMNAEGRALHRLTRSPAYDGNPAWSADGRRIAFRTTRDGNAELYVMNADGSGQTRLTRSPADEGPFAWSRGQQR